MAYEWTCPCGERMYSADRCADQEKVTCVTCGQLFDNPYYSKKAIDDGAL